MNNRSLIPLGVVLLALAAIAAYRFGFESVPDSSFAPPDRSPAVIGQPPRVLETSALKLPGQPMPPPQPPRVDSAPVQSADDLDMMFRNRVAAALEREDFMAFQKAFFDTFSSPLATREAALESLRKQMNHEKLWVRVYIISWMYLLDDRSGRAELVRIASLPEPSVYKTMPSSKFDSDARMDAARVIGRNFDRAAASVVLAAHRREPFPGLLDNLVLMEVPEAGPLLRELQSKPPTSPMVELYGYCGDKQDLPYLNRLFYDLDGRIDIRLAAAWAITRIEANPDATSLIRKQAELRLADKGYVPLGAMKAVKYLGTQKDPESVKLLERIAAEASSSEVVRTALANLAFNHASTSAVGREALAVEARRQPGKLGVVLANRIAIASKEPGLDDLRAKLAQAQAATKWKLNGIHRVPLTYYVFNAPHE